MSNTTKPRVLKLTASRKVTLAREVYDVILQEFDTFREENIGADLAYVLGAILDPQCHDCVDWTARNYGEDWPPPILKALQEAFSVKSPLRRFIIADAPDSHRHECPGCHEWWACNEDTLQTSVESDFHDSTILLCPDCTKREAQPNRETRKHGGRSL